VYGQLMLCDVHLSPKAFTSETMPRTLGAHAVQAATLLVGALRQRFPDLVIHVHTHDSAGTGVATQVTTCLLVLANLIRQVADAVPYSSNRQHLLQCMCSCWCLSVTDSESSLLFACLRSWRQQQQVQT
jgi:hypothetical protein